MKKLRMSEQEIEANIKKFRDFLQKKKTFDESRFSFSIEETKKKPEHPASIIFSEKANTKILMLLHYFSTEVGWHGVGRKTDRGYYIEDIILYPQTVTGATVNTDGKAITEWAMSIDADTYNSIIMQGHSHVNMQVFPSGTDKEDQKRYVDGLDSGFYCFMIFNKKGDIWSCIVDFDEDVIYEDHDIDIIVDGYDYQDFLNEADELVEEKRFTYTSSAKTAAKKHTGFPYYGGYYDSDMAGYIQDRYEEESEDK